MKKDLYLFIVYGLIGFFGLIIYFTAIDTFFMFVAVSFLIIASVIHFKKYKTQVIKDHKPRHVKLLD